MNKLENKKSAVDLTELAIGIVILGVVVSIGGYIIVTQRDTHLTELTQYTTTAEKILTTPAGTNLANKWFVGVSSVYNATNASNTISSGNYTVSVDTGGTGRLTWLGTSTFNATYVNVTYSAYNLSSRADYTVSNQAAIGIAEYGNWFKIIVIVGVAAVVLALILTGIKGRNEGTGGEY